MQHKLAKTNITYDNQKLIQLGSSTTYKTSGYNFHSDHRTSTHSSF